MGYAQRAVAQADSGGRQGDAHGSARPSAGQSAKKKGSILRRDGCAGCCPSAVALGGRRASGRRRSSARRSGCGDEPAPFVSALRSARPRYDPRPPSCRQGQPSDELSDSGDGGADWRGWTSSSAADPGQDRGSDGQQTGRRAGDPAASSRRPPAARSVPSAGQVNSVPARGQAPSSARRSSPDAAQSGRRRRHPVSLGWQSCRVSERASSRT